MGAIFKREFKAYFTSPVGYIVLAAFLFFFGMSFTSMYAGGSADIYYVFSGIFTVVVLAIPILTMRLMSEDKRQKVDQALLTAPVRLSSIVLGKYLAALAVFSVAFAITLVYQLIFALYVTPDWTIYLGNLVGILLFGSALIAIGLFISSLTDSQVVAALGSLAVSLVLIMIDSISQLTSSAFITTIVGWISFSGRYQAFVNGIFDLSNVIYFLSLTAVFLFLSVRVLEKKRWA